MGKRLKYSSLLLLPVAVLALWVASRSTCGPEYDGRPLSFWVEQQAAGDLRKERAAAEAIQAIGADAVPHLIATLTKTESCLTARVVPLVRRVPFINVKYTPLRERQRLAAKACEALGPRARSAAPALAKLLAVPELTDVAAAALGQTGPDSIPYLMSAARDGDSTVRFYAMHALEMTRGFAGTYGSADLK